MRNYLQKESHLSPRPKLLSEEILAILACKNIYDACTVNRNVGPFGKLWFHEQLKMTYFFRPIIWDAPISHHKKPKFPSTFGLKVTHISSFEREVDTLNDPRPRSWRLGPRFVRLENKDGASFAEILSMLMATAWTVTNNLAIAVLLWAKQQRQSRLFALSSNCGLPNVNIFAKRRNERKRRSHLRRPGLFQSSFRPISSC